MLLSPTEASLARVSFEDPSLQLQGSIRVEPVER